MEGARILVGVKVLDAKSAYGSVRLLVTPLEGEGETWVQGDRFKLTP